MLQNLLNKTKISLGIMNTHDIAVIRKIGAEGIELFHVLTSLPTMKNTYKTEYGEVIELEIKVQFDLNPRVLEYISELRSLKKLSLHSNQIKEFPDSLSNLTKLEKLYLGFNNANKIPDFVYGIYSLKVLNITYNQIEEINSRIENLIYLEEFDVSNNKVKKISNNIDKLHRLKFLYLGANKLNNIPEGVLKLSNLEVLDMFNNEIKHIPPEIVDLYSLRELSFNNHSFFEEKDNPLSRPIGINMITKLPESMLNMSNLENIGLVGNPVIKNIEGIENFKGNEIIVKIVTHQNKLNDTGSISSKSKKVRNHEVIQNNDISDLGNIVLNTGKKNTRQLKVFLCHSSGDKQQVRELYELLADQRFTPWLDEVDLLVGQNWELEIPQAVKAAHVVIICLSQHSITKEGYVQKEIKFSLDAAEEKPEGTIFIMPVKLEACTIPHRLSHLHTIDISNEHGIKKLIQSLNHKRDSLK